MSLFNNQNAANVTEKETVTIGLQSWAKKNLARTYFRNGDPILVASSSTQFSASGVAGIPACYPYYSTTDITNLKNRSIYAAEYGYLYNYWALIDSRSIAPEGFRIPSSTEILTLYDSVGGDLVAGGSLKELGSTHWNANSIVETSNSGSFNWLPGGRYDIVNGIVNINNYGYLGTNTRASATQSKRYRVDYNTVRAYIVESSNGTTGVYRVFANGHSARCIKITEDYTPRTTIGNQTWTTNNLDVTTYSDGTPIPEASSSAQWAAASTAKTGAWCHYGDNFTSGSVYGKLYNWYAVAGIYDATSAADPTKRKSLAPIGYHIPTKAEWNNLTSSLGGASVAGGKMKQAGTTYWLAGNTGDNSSGFTALPGGDRSIPAGTFDLTRATGFYWSSVESNTTYAEFYYISYLDTILRTGNTDKSNGFSVRCVEDIVTSPVIPTLQTTLVEPEATTIFLTNKTIFDGGATVTSRGVVWDTSPNPTIALGTKATTPSGSNIFNAIATGLSTSTPYYVRAYVSNSAGILYGPETLATTTTADGTIDHAYSVRKVVPAYAGSAMLVRRSSDNASSSIGFNPSGDLDTGSLLTFVGFGNDGYVKTWYDQSGNAKHVTNPTTTQQPVIVNAGVLQTKNNRPAIVFQRDNLTRLFKTDTTIQLNNLSSYVVTSTVSPTSTQDPYALGVESNRYYIPILISSNAYVGYGSDYTTINLGGELTDNNLYSSKTTSTGITGSRNGAIKGTYTSNPADYSSLIQVGYANNINHLDGTIQEIITHIGNSSPYTKSAEIMAYYSILQT